MPRRAAPLDPSGTILTSPSFIVSSMGLCTMTSTMVIQLMLGIRVFHRPGHLSVQIMIIFCGRCVDLNSFSSCRYPVIAFTGAPAAFPVQQQNLPLQQFVVWQEKWKSRARTWLQQNLPPGPFVGVHLRNGGDWVRACEHVDKGLEQLFSSPQCLGYRGEHGKLTKELCLPSLATVARQVRRAAKEVKAVAVFVASDSDHLLDQLRNELRTTRLSFHKQESNPPDTQLDLVILGQSNIFIGNCVSSFSAFVARGRAVHGLPTQFFGFSQKNEEEKSNIHTEL